MGEGKDFGELLIRYIGRVTNDCCIGKEMCAGGEREVSSNISLR